MAEIINSKGPEVIDSERPLSYTDWLKVHTNDLSTDIGYSSYFKYVKEWQQTSTGNTEEIRINLYKNILKEIYLVYSSSEEQRFLKNLDFDNPQEAEIAIPFVVNKLADIAAYYKKKRDELKYKVQSYWSLGTESGIKNTIKELILDFVKNNERNSQYKLLYIKDQLNIRIDEFYDSYQYYFDYDVQETVGQRKDFTSELQKTEFNEFINEQEEILAEIRKYPLILNEIENENLTFHIETSDRTLLERFDLINNNRSDLSDENLLITLKKDYILNFIGSDAYELIVDANKNWSIKLLAKAKRQFDNRLNTTIPTIQNVESDEHRVSAKSIGDFFAPHKQGLLFYDVNKKSYSIDQANLEANTRYIFPDPQKMGDIRGCKRGDQVDIPIIYQCDISDIRYFSQHGIRNGEVKSNSNDILMTGYASKEQKTFSRPKTIESNFQNFNPISQYGTAEDYFDTIFGDSIVKFNRSHFDWQYPQSIFSKENYIKSITDNYYIFNQNGFIDPLTNIETDYVSTGFIDDGSRFGTVLTGLSTLDGNGFFIESADQQNIEDFFSTYFPEMSFEDARQHVLSQENWIENFDPLVVTYGPFLPDYIPNERLYQEWIMFDGGKFADDEYNTTDFYGFPALSTHYEFQLLLETNVLSSDGFGNYQLPWIDYGSSYPTINQIYQSSFESLSTTNGLFDADGGYFNDVETLGTSSDIDLIYDQQLNPIFKTNVLSSLSSEERPTIINRQQQDSVYMIRTTDGDILDLSSQFENVFTRNNISEQITYVTAYNNVFLFETQNKIIIEKLEKQSQTEYNSVLPILSLIKNAPYEYQTPFYSKIFNAFLFASVQKIQQDGHVGNDYLVVPKIEMFSFANNNIVTLFDGMDTPEEFSLSSTWISSLSGIEAVNEYIDVDFIDQAKPVIAENQSLNQIQINTTFFDLNNVSYLYSFKIKFNGESVVNVENGIVMPRAHTITLDIKYGLEEKYPNYPLVVYSNGVTIDEQNGVITFSET